MDLLAYEGVGMNVTEIARLMGVSRPTAYKIVRCVGFPKPLQIKPPRWSAAEVAAWYKANRARGVAVVGGVIVKQ